MAERKVFVFFADGFEEVEALTVVDLLRRAEIQTIMVAAADSLDVTGAHNITVKADVLLDSIEDEEADMLVLPGGMPGTVNLMENKKLVQMLKRQNADGKLLAAICAAPSVLGMNHILEGKKAVCYPGFEDKLLKAEVTTATTVCDQNVITSKGLGTAIEFSLAIIETLIDEAAAKKIGDAIQYAAK